MLDSILILITTYPIYAAIIAFMLGWLTDWVWAKWTLCIKNNNALGAANFSVLMYLFGIIYTLFIIDKSILPLILYITGGWIGTYFAVKYSKKKEK
jgi:hypothetical protein